MRKPLRIEREADRELEEAARRYEEKRSGLGTGFLRAVDEALTRIALFPATGTLVPHVPRELGARRAPVAGFPYHVVYLEEANAIRILAVAHARRRPGYWIART